MIFQGNNDMCLFLLTFVDPNLHVTYFKNYLSINIWKYFKFVIEIFANLVCGNYRVNFNTSNRLYKSTL